MDLTTRETHDMDLTTRQQLAASRAAARRAAAGGALLLLSLLAASPHASALSYDDFAVPAGENPQSVRATDCDGNGTPDIITADFGSKTVTIFSNAGSGVFAERRTITTANPVAGADCGDFDGDGIYDVAAASFAAGTVTIYKGEVGGGFTPTVSYAVGAGSRSVAAADLDGDSHLDLVVANAQSDNLALLFGDGIGAFPSIASVRVHTINQANSPFSATVDDVNGDGLPDIIVATLGSPSVHVILNGSLGFGLDADAIEGPPGGRGVAAGDIDGDGITDLAVLGIDSVVTLYHGTQQGKFTKGASFAVGAEARSIALADFSQHGLLDLAVLYNISNSVDIFRAVAPGVFPTVDPFASAVVLNPFGAAAARPGANGGDVVFIDQTARSMSVARHTGLGVLGVSPLETLPDRSQVLLLADFTGDGHADALVLAKGRRGVEARVLLGTSTGAFQAMSNEPAVCGNGILEGAELCDDGNAKKRDGCSPACSPEITRGALWMQAADMDGDGDLDIVLVDAQSNLLLLLGDGAGHFPTVRNLGRVRSKTTAAIGDFNGDGTIDIAILPKARGDGALALLVNDGAGNFSKTALGLVGRFVSPLLAGDLDGDGRLDVLVGTKDKPLGFVALLNDGTGPRLRMPTIATPKGLRSLAAADFDEDGILDVVTEFSKRQGPVLFRGAGAGSYTPIGVVADSGFTALRIVDLDGDRHHDLVSCAGSGAVPCRALYGTGQATFGGAPASVPETIGTNVWAGAAGDFDGDGIPDIVGVSKSDSVAAVLFGGASGAQPGRVDLVPGSKPTVVAVADLDLDGKPDIIASNEGSNDLSIFLNTGNRTFASLARVGTGGVNPGRFALGDLNHDGRIDAAVPLSGSSTVALFHNRVAGGFTRVATLPTGASPQGAAIGDLNGDGDGDVATANFDNHTVSVFLSDGAGGYTASTLSSAGQHPTDVVIVDLDEQNGADLVVVNSNTKTLVVFLNDGSGGFGPPTITPAFGRTLPWDLCTGDFDGDGQQDVALGSIGTSDVLVLRGSGDGTWASDMRVFPIGHDPNYIFCDDVDGDGRTDIVFPNRDTSRVGMILTGPTP